MENTRLVYRISDPDGDDAITVCLNLDDDAMPHDVADGEEILEGGLAPHEAAVIGRP